MSRVRTLSSSVKDSQISVTITLDIYCNITVLNSSSSVDDGDDVILSELRFCEGNEAMKSWRVNHFGFHITLCCFIIELE